MRIHRLPTLLLAGVWGAIWVVPFWVGFMLLLEVAEQVLPRDAGECGCAIARPYFTALGDAFMSLPLFVPISAALWVGAGSIGWLLIRKTGMATLRQGAWFGAFSSVGVAVLLLGIVALGRSLFRSWDPLEWEVLAAAGVVMALAAPIGAFGGWLLVRVNETKTVIESA